MKTRSTQFDLRENTASAGQHAPRLATDNGSNTICIEEAPQIQRRSFQTDGAAHEIGNALHAAPEHAATAEGEAGYGQHASAAATPQHTKHANDEFEPLLDSIEAARLLGNIHVKTLQRYARQGRIPGYQVAGHWYFRASELDRWLRSQLNSIRQSVRSN